MKHIFISMSFPAMREDVTSKGLTYCHSASIIIGVVSGSVVQRNEAFETALVNLCKTRR